MAEFKQTYLPDSDESTPFEKVGDNFVVNNTIQTSDFVKGKSGVQISPSSNQFLYSEVIDDDGTMPEDNATVGATAGTNLKDSSLIVLEDNEIKNIGIFQLGESLSAGDIVCSKLTDEALQSITDDAYIVHTYPTSNYGNETNLYAGYSDGNYVRYSYLKISTTGLPADVDQIVKVYLRLYFSTWHPNTKATFEIKVNRITQNWVEGDINYNNRPTVADFDSMTLSYNNDYIINGYIDIDITILAIAWIEGLYDNFGIMIQKSAFEENDQYVAFKSSDHPTTTERPKTYMNTLWATSDKVYGASCDDYYLCRTIIGYLLESGDADDYCKVQMQGIISHATGEPGTRFFLGSNSPVMTAFNAPTSAERAIALGFKPTEDTFLLDIQRRDILINSPIVLGTKYYTIGDARYAIADGKMYPKGATPWDTENKYIDGSYTTVNFYN